MTAAGMQQSNQAMPFRQAQGPERAEGQRTAGRCAFQFSMTSTLNIQRRALPPALADLVSR